MRQLIQYSNGERRVIDTETMTASAFLAPNEANSPLSEYELDEDLDGRDLDPNSSEFRVLRSESDERSVMCTGCGKSLLKSEAHYGDHADTYSGTTWHCNECWDACSREVRE